MSLNHQRILMRHLLEQPTPQNIGVLLALCTGMRIGEVCALKWEDVDFAQKTVIVKHTVGRIYNCELKSTERVHSSPKTKNSYREIPISKQLLQALKMVRKQSQSPYVVGTSTQSKEPRSYRDYFGRLLKRLDIPHLVFHGLSHSKFFYLLNISELSILKNVTANDLETSYILFLSQLCNIQRTL